MIIIAQFLYLKPVVTLLLELVISINNKWWSAVREDGGQFSLLPVKWTNFDKFC